MKRRAKCGLIIGVVLVVILGVGFGVYRIFFVPKPLKIKDLEKAYITVPRSSIEEGCGIDIYGTSETLTAYGPVVLGFGAIYDNQNVFIDLNSSGTAIPIHIWVQESDERKYMQAGDTLEITYDGGQKLTIYMPEGWGKVYVATDGSTYYDRALTQLAWSPDSAEPLRIKDLEKARITTTRSSAGGGWTFGFLTAGDFAMGSVRDNSNYFDDEMVCETGAMPVKIKTFQIGQGITVRAGDTLEITYDGGQSLIIYLPEISEDGSVLYVASDGSTYYDKDLTKLAQKVPISSEEGRR